MVITFWILNGSMLAGCSSPAYGKLQNRVKYYYAFQTYSGIHFVNIFHIIDSPHVSADTFNNYQMFKTSNGFFKSITNSSNIKPCNISWGWCLCGAITGVFYHLHCVRVSIWKQTFYWQSGPDNGFCRRSVLISVGDSKPYHVTMETDCFRNTAFVWIARRFTCPGTN